MKQKFHLRTVLGSLLLASMMSSPALSASGPELNCRVEIPNLPCSAHQDAIITVTARNHPSWPNYTVARVSWVFPEQCFARAVSGELEAYVEFREYAGVKIGFLSWAHESLKAFEAANEDPLGGGVMWEVGMFTRYRDQNFIRIDQDNQVSLLSFDGVMLDQSGSFVPSQSRAYSLQCEGVNPSQSVD